MNVLIADFLQDSSIEGPVLDGVAEVVVARAHHEDALAPHLAEADAIILFHDIERMTDATFQRAPRCRVVVRAGVGYNNVDLGAAGSRGIAVCNVPDYGTEEVADHSIMLLLAVARHLVIQDASMKAGSWDYLLGQDTPRLRGKTLGIVGCGRIGSATALRAKAFGLDVVFYDPYAPSGLEKALGVRREFRLEPLLEQSDFVSLHCFLDDRSRHLINARTLASMRPGSILINTARGPVVEQEALIEALESGHLLGAGIDVFEREPLDDARLRAHPRVILTPHSAFYSIEGFVELRTKAAEEVRRILLGEAPRNLVNVAMISNPRAALSDRRI
ncbi:C-terminal binding protein [Tundrisphaera lichenicola]|uniref:C-terminal binding protein n=1 Tax=Tundrisphaera lichenicola TaxID=2029860 RepID=UPI003EB9DFFF